MSDKKKELGFVRKHPMPGVYGICYKKRQIQIKNREVFFTDDKGLIKIFKTDPEIMEFQPEPEEKEVIEYAKMSKKNLLKICKKRNIDSTKIEEKDLINVLKKYDEINSASENDQGEQDPK